MKHFEFWPPRLFELPYYLYLLAGALRRGLSVRDLARANYALDHGEIGIGSKYQTQLAFDQTFFLPTAYLPPDLNRSARKTLIEQFGQQHGFPVIVKSDIGSVGKGVIKIDTADAVDARLDQLAGPFIIQAFTPWNVEYGVFYVRHHGVAQITAINKKHFPSILGDGVRSIAELVRVHPRYTDHWRTFLQYIDIERVPAKAETVRLSFIGSHTMGCKFTEDTHLLSRELAAAVDRVVADQPGFNFGRLDVKTASEADFQQGRFVVIEVNGVASLPTNMFDPSHSVWTAYGIFLRHGRHLLDAASEHRHQPMRLDSYRNIIKRVRVNARQLNTTHQRLMQGDA